MNGHFAPLLYLVFLICIICFNFSIFISQNIFERGLCLRKYLILSTDKSLVTRHTYWHWEQLKSWWKWALNHICSRLPILPGEHGRKGRCPGARWGKNLLFLANMTIVGFQLPVLSFFPFAKRKYQNIIFLKIVDVIVQLQKKNFFKVQW